jgi:hypothetical protein
MDRRIFMFSLAGTALAAVLPEAAEAAPAWRKLGTRRVNGLVDVDSILVGAGQGTFKRLRIRVRGNALLIYDLRVRYGNGADDRLQVRALIPQGGYSRAIDLRGNNRYLRAVTFTYGKLPNGAGPTFVELYGIR